MLRSRRDSLVAAGDSTLVIATVGGAMTDSTTADRVRSRGASERTAGFAAPLNTAAARMQAEAEL